MTELDRDTVAEALDDSLRRLIKPASGGGLGFDQGTYLLDVMNPFTFAQLIADLEASLDVALPMDQIDAESIARIDRLIAFICRQR
ncbi:MAG: hypothetical protein AAF543_10935 [Pseudomonadota bacterium]